MSDVKNTGIGHDDDGNIDDKRIAGWITLGTGLAIGVLDLFSAFEAQPAIFNTLVYAGAIMLGVTVFEKFTKKEP